MMTSLADLANSLEKTAGARPSRQPDEWDRAAAEAGMTTEEFMDKVAEQRVQAEKELVKEAQRHEYMGHVMAHGYYDTIYKVASAHPVRDEVPAEFIKVARKIRAGLITSIIKSANTKERADKIMAVVGPVLQKQL